MIMVACSMVVRSAASGAVLCTALVSASLIFGASVPIERASGRIGTTSATTASTTTMPITQPITQPVLLVPAARTCSCMEAPQTVSQKSRTGFRLALTEVSRSGTVLVRSATACTPPVVETSVARMARRWKITRTRPTAVIATISAETISVNQAAAGMVVLPSPQELRDGARIADRADGDFIDGGAGGGQRPGQPVEFADELDAAGQDPVGCAADPLERREHAVQQEDHDGQHHHQQDDVADPPQEHRSSLLKLC